MGSTFEKYGIIQRFVDVSDAEFILELRLNEKLSRFISKTNAELSNQIEWIKEYKKREEAKNEFYFITVDKSGARQGVSRLYNFTENSFEVGSWLFSPNAPGSSSILSDIATREFGFENLKTEFCNFEVRKKNKNVIAYHLRYNPEVIDEDDLNIYFRLSNENFQKNKFKYLKIFGYGN